MSETEISTIRLYKTTIERLRKYKQKGTSDDWVVNYVLDKVDEKEA